MSKLKLNETSEEYGDELEELQDSFDYLNYSAQFMNDTSMMKPIEIENDTRQSSQ